MAVGDKQKPLQRALKYDGYMPLKWGANGQEVLTIDDWQTILPKIPRENKHFDLIHMGMTSGNNPRARQNSSCTLYRN